MMKYLHPFLIIEYVFFSLQDLLLHFHLFHCNHLTDFIVQSLTIHIQWEQFLAKYITY